MHIIDDDDRSRIRKEERKLTIADARLGYLCKSSSPFLNILKSLKALNPDGEIRYHSPHHKKLKEQQHLLKAEGITLVTTPPSWCRSKSAVAVAMLNDLYLKAPDYSEVILVSGSADFTIAVQWLWRVHWIPTTIAVPQSVRVAKSLLAVARAHHTIQ